MKVSYNVWDWWEHMYICGVEINQRNKRSQGMKKHQLANEFSKKLNEWLTPADIAEINLRNSTTEYQQQGYCATHEFWDPNQAMIDAFNTLFGKEPSLQNQAHGDLIYKAWDIASKRGFGL